MVGACGAVTAGSEGGGADHVEDKGEILWMCNIHVYMYNAHVYVITVE